MQRKTSFNAQTVKDAEVYILRLNTLQPTLAEELLTELNAHLAVLQVNPGVVLIVAPPLLPEPGSVHPDVEATARLHDLSRIQMSNQGGGIEFGEFMELISTVRDNYGRLVVSQKLRYRNETVAAVTIKYELYVNSANMSM